VVWQIAIGNQLDPSPRQPMLLASSPNGTKPAFDQVMTKRSDRRRAHWHGVVVITRSRSEHPKGRRIPAGDIEGLVLDRLRALLVRGSPKTGNFPPINATGNR
jgi:hypothetical protein